VLYSDENLSFYWQEGILMCDWHIEHGSYEFVDYGIKKRLELTGDKQIVMLSDIRKLKTTTREARQRMAAEDGQIGLLAVGVVMNSKLQATIFNFFMKINFPSTIPTKVFSNKEDAILWCKSFIKTEPNGQ
jgi:hypothetical protein